MSNLVLAGFMGAGKTAAGRRAAELLGWPFVDMDDEIEKAAGMRVADIFERCGEAEFRGLEREVCRELAQRDGWVIAAGGGALVNGENLAALSINGIVVHLDCSFEEALRRAAAQPGVRPLLANGVESAARLFQTRQPIYQNLPWQVKTDGRTVEEVAQDLASLGAMKRLRVRHTAGSYPIWISRGLIHHTGEMLRQVGVERGRKVALVVSDVVAPLYAEAVETALARAGLNPVRCVIPDGEAHKRLDTIALLYGAFADAGLERGDLAAALGGGVTGDMAGFAAATYLRGVRVAQIPTTLLAMVDASIGGKTGVDLPQGKNLAGAFHQPIAVLADPCTLASLPPEELRSGMAEAIKHGLLADPELYEALTSRAGDGSFLWRTGGEGWLQRAIAVKTTVVEEDPFEKGRRATLNLGHTAGHALERVSNYQLRHGEAVGLGMLVAAGIAERLGLARAGLRDQIASGLAGWGLPVQLDEGMDLDAVTAAMQFDKKKNGGRVKWILPRDVGNVLAGQEVEPDLAREEIQRLWQNAEE